MDSMNMLWKSWFQGNLILFCWMGSSTSASWNGSGCFLFALWRLQFHASKHGWNLKSLAISGIGKYCSASSSGDKAAYEMKRQVQCNLYWWEMAVCRRLSYPIRAYIVTRYLSLAERKRLLFWRNQITLGMQLERREEPWSILLTHGLV